jgi:hypothetical protein
MAPRTLTATNVPAYLQTLIAALQKRLPDAEIWTERVRRDRYTVSVVSKRFDRMGHPERQHLVWDVAEKAVPGTDVRKIGMILTLRPGDIGSDH